MAAETGAANIWTGATSAKLTAGAGKDTKIVQASITVVPEQDYYLRYHTKDDGADEGRHLVYDVDNAGDIVALEGSGDGSGSWGLVNVAFTAPAGCTEVRIEFHCPDNDGSIVYVDNAYFGSALYGGVFDSWIANPGAGKIELESTLINEGSQACKITAGSPADTYISQTITVTAETD